MALIKLNQILFRNGTYYINQDLDYKNLRSEIINKAFEYTKVQTWENIEEIRQEIKKIDWTKFSVNWDLEHGGWNNQFGKRESGILKLDPYSDCSLQNPLYKHKQWVERIINDTRFNMTDLRFAELCNISESTAYSWRWEKFNIHMLNRGQYRLIVDNEIHRGVFIKLPDSYNNPYAIEKVNSNAMPEHRYIIERYFSQKIISQKYSEYLLDNKYLKPEYDVHHINLDPFDNRIENLWVTDDHNGIHANLRSLVQPLLEYNYLFFGGGEYFLYSTKC